MTRSERAMQVWQILVGAAHNRQTLTYGQVAEHFEFEGAGVLSQILNCIMEYRPPRNGNRTWLKFGQIFVEKLKFREKSQYKST